MKALHRRVLRNDREICNERDLVKEGIFQKGLKFLEKMMKIKILSYIVKIVPCENLIKKVKILGIFQVFNKNVRKVLKKWKFEVVRIKNVRNGLGILNKQRLRKEKEEKKEVFRESGIFQVYLEKGFLKIERIFKRNEFFIKGEAWNELVQEFFCSCRVKNAEVVIKNRVVRKVWRFLCDFTLGNKKMREGALEKLKKLEKKIKKKVFERIMSRDVTVLRLNLEIFKHLMQKVLKKVGKFVFSQVLNESFSEKTIKLRILSQILKEVEKKRLTSYFSRLKQDLRGYSIKKANISLQKLTILLKKRFNQFKVRLVGLNLETKMIKFWNGKEKLTAIQRKHMKTYIKLIKPQSFHQFSLPIRIISMKIERSLTRLKLHSLKCLKIHKNYSRIAKSSGTLKDFFLKKGKSLKKTSMKAIKSYLANKKQMMMLWKIKFYQIEGLIQHKKEEISLKSKFKHLKLWKTNTTHLNRHHKKLQKHRLSSLISSLSSYLQYTNLSLKSSSFLLLKLLYLKQRTSLSSLSRIFQNSLKRVSFSTFFSKTQISQDSLLKDPPSVQTHKSFTSFPLKGKYPGRYGFYSLKNLTPNSKPKEKVLKIVRNYDLTAPSILDHFEEIMRKSFDSLK